MRNPQIKLGDLVVGLERLGAKYEAIDVLADDVLEAQSAMPIEHLTAIGADGRTRASRRTGPDGRAGEAGRERCAAPPG
jgi:hypothetical protein